MKHLVLNGFMAAGKSTVGPLVAAGLDLPFVDLDEMIEKRARKTVAEIFSEGGEAAFRRFETEAMGICLAGPTSVVATGGGALQDDGSRRLAESTALIITLTCQVSELVRRMESQQAVRPWVNRVLARSEPLAQAVERLLCERSWIYDAYPSVETGGRPVDEVVAEVTAVYARYGAGEHGAAYELTFPGHSRSEIVLGSTAQPAIVHWLIGADAISGSNPSAVALIAEETVAELYGARLLGILEGAAPSRLILVPDGEKAKSLDTIREVYGQLRSGGFDREGLVLALGGGVVTDLAGFAAATFLRGLGLALAPTTLLAQVDAAIGGKTSVDFDGVKNLVGSFYPARRMVVDISLLRSLPPARVREGVAEVIKIAVARDQGLFEELEKLFSFSEIREREDLVRRAVRNKVEVVNHDPLERTGVRSLLNLGHTIGHAVESASRFRIPHGDCVAMGLAAEARLALELGLTGEATVERIVDLLRRLELPTDLPELSRSDLMRCIHQDKKRVRGETRMALPSEIGRARLLTVPDHVVETVLRVQTGSRPLIDALRSGTVG